MKTRIIPPLLLLSLALLTSSCAKPDHDAPSNTDSTSGNPFSFVNDTFVW